MPKIRDPITLSRKGSEVWASLSDLGYPGYTVSNMGRVGKLIVGSKDAYNVLSVSTDRGYRKVNLYIDRKVITRRVCALMLLGFVGPRPDGHEARHLDDKRDNDKLYNLAWGTHAENMQDRKRNGGYDNQPRGERSPRSVLTDKEVGDIKWILKNTDMGAAEIARKFKVTAANIYSIKSGATWGHI